jgi:DNA-binding NarL/FixJ family response regulator
MSDRILVTVHAGDPLSHAGMTAQLRACREIEVLDGVLAGAVAGGVGGGVEGAVAGDVALVVVDEVDAAAVQTVKALRQDGSAKIVVIATRLDDQGLLGAVEAGACALLRRADALPDRLVATIRRASAGDGSVPPDLLGRLLEQLGRLQREVLSPRGVTFSGLSEREVEVLRLVADGLDTTEVAGRLCYSERTVKNVLHDVTTRLRLRNRTHAVAYALRHGLI